MRLSRKISISLAFMNKWIAIPSLRQDYESSVLPYKLEVPMKWLNGDDQKAVRYTV